MGYYILPLIESLRSMRSFCTACCMFAVFVVNSQASESLKLPVIQDNSIVLVDGEWNENAGQKGRIRIKGNQHIVAMAFDMSPLHGMNS